MNTSPTNPCSARLRGAEAPTGEAVARDVDVQVVGVAVHKVRERGEKVMGVRGSGRSFRVVLHREYRRVEELDALGGAIIQVHVREPDAPEVLVLHDGGHAALRPEA